MDNKKAKPTVSAGSHTVYTRSRDDTEAIVELVVFTMGDEEFAANIDQVREVITKGTITPIPDSPKFVEGITNVRGEITVAIDLKGGLSLKSPKDIESKHVIITEQNNNLFGLIVDQVTEVLRIPKSQIKPAPEAVTKMERVKVSGVITLDDRLIILLDLSTVLSEESLAQLADLRQEVGADLATGGDEAKKMQQAAKALLQQTSKTEAGDKESEPVGVSASEPEDPDA